MITPAQLGALQHEIEEHAHAMGFDFFPVVYEMVDYLTMSEVAAYGGFPTRYPHWSFGMEYDRLAKGYGYGLSKIYEMVVNTNPVYAYLLDSNALIDQKMVIAHVCGHAHFFKNNYYFSQTNRKMMDEMANHGNRIRRIMARYGALAVENFIDCCLTIEGLIDLHAPFIRRHDDAAAAHDQAADAEGPDQADGAPADLITGSAYMRDFLNPPAVLHERRRQARERAEAGESFPAQPAQDVPAFLLAHAPLAPWQAEVLAIIREEAYYFAPQGQTKILNEGCACWAHTRLMTQKILQPADVIDYAAHHAGTVANQPGRINPYRLGLALLNDIEHRYDRGRFGKEWDECDDRSRLQKWDTGAGLGKAKVFEVWQHFNDVSFIDEFLTPAFVAEHLFFGYEWNDSTEAYTIATRDFKIIKEKLLFGLTNHGRPFITVRDGNYANRGELLLEHRYQGLELKTDEANDVLRNLYTLWKRPVHLATCNDEGDLLLSFDGSEHSAATVQQV